MRLIDADGIRIKPEFMHDVCGMAMIRVEDIVRILNEQPTIQPKRGKWISADAMFGGVPFYCSECGENTRDTVMGEPRWNFCPNCGAKMEVNSESN